MRGGGGGRGRVCVAEVGEEGECAWRRWGKRESTSGRWGKREIRDGGRGKGRLYVTEVGERETVRDGGGGEGDCT